MATLMNELELMNAAQETLKRVGKPVSLENVRRVASRALELASDLPEPQNVALAARPAQADWLAKVELVRKTYASDLTPPEFELFVEVAKARGLNPLLKQIYALKYGGKMTIITAIDAFRLIAERTGKYEGQTPPYWCGEDGIWKDVWVTSKPPVACRVGVYRQGAREPLWGVARFEAYTTGSSFWKKSGDNQLAKCCEALALRKAFPEELGGLYASEEMEQAGHAPVIALPTNTIAPAKVIDVPQAQAVTTAQEMLSRIQTATSLEQLSLLAEEIKRGSLGENDKRSLRAAYNTRRSELS